MQHGLLGFAKEESGTTAIEYGLIAALLAGVAGVPGPPRL
jgi:Flp pilus assembly pilin Flp